MKTHFFGCSNHQVLFFVLGGLARANAQNFTGGFYSPWAATMQRASADLDVAGSYIEIEMVFFLTR